MATIEIDGKILEAENGKMIIDVADEANIHIPRFCYHKKLSRPANCRMCLVEVANGRKPVPACATPISEGMKVFTRSEEALRSQKAVMEFLLINHPLDCPICDQGGECELQDVSMGYGRDMSEYEESKRAVEDDNLGSLISTEMTRCIHCTRCVRFGDEIGGLRELGATGRGEEMQIGTYVAHSMTSEISGNIIDLCPVGALTSKPFRFTARPWELTAHSSIAPHDCLGSHVELHVRRNEVMRVVPKEVEHLNETWLSDRDRFSYLGLKSPERAKYPMIKRDGQWEKTDWATALQFAATAIQRIVKHHGAQEFAALASSSSTVEEFYLLQKMMRELGVTNIDYRLQQADFRDSKHQSIKDEYALPYAEIENQKQILLFGCNLIEEVPLAAVRVRKALSKGAAAYAVNAYDYDFHFAIKDKAIISPQEMPFLLGKVLLLLVKEDLSLLPEELQPLLLGLKPDAFTKELAKSLKMPLSVICTGALLENHNDAALLRTLMSTICEISGARWVRFTQGANAKGAEIAGMVPHRDASGRTIESSGLNAEEALQNKLKGYLLLNVSPGFDCRNPAGARQAMLAAECVIQLTAFESEGIYDYADVILPIAPFAETSGTYINVNDEWQSFLGAVTPHEEARPAWKVLRVLGNLLEISGFEYDSSEKVLEELKTVVAISSHKETKKRWYPKEMPIFHEGLLRIGEWPIYRVDAIVRHAEALQQSALSKPAVIRIHPDLARELGLSEFATVSQGNIEITLPLEKDDRLAPDVVWIPNGMPETLDLGHAFSHVTIQCENR